MKGKKYSDDFKKRMIEFYRGNQEVDLNKAQEHAKTLGSETFSRNMHNQLRGEARGPAEALKEVVIGLSAGRLIKLESAKAGDRVAIYSLKRLGRVQVQIVDEL
jgi:hypothetical protein